MRVRLVKIGSVLLSLSMFVLLSATSADATVISVGVGAFGAGSTLTTFTGLADGTEVNGLNVGGILFTYSLGSGNLIIDGGPGITNNVNPPDIVSTGNGSGTLSLALPSLADTFGFGYALSTVSAVPNAPTINLFQGVTQVGSLSYNSAPDPTFSGGFAGIQSTIRFNNVQIKFNSVAALSFALDNIRTVPAAVPEPSTVELLGVGIATLLSLQFLPRKGKKDKDPGRENSERLTSRSRPTAIPHFGPDDM